MPFAVPRPPNREVAVLAAVGFSVAVGFGIVAPAIPLLARSFGVGDLAASAVISAFALMRLVSALGGGALVERYGERVVLAVGIAVVAASSAAAGAAPSYPWLLGLRAVGGVGSAMFSISALSLLLRSVPRERRGAATGLFSGSFLVGGVLGPAIGGLVTDTSPRTPFFLYAGTLAVAGTIGLLALPHAPGRAAAGDEAPAVVEDPRTSLREAIRLPAYRAALAAYTAQTWSSLGLRSSVIPLFVTASATAGGLDRPARDVGLGLGLSAALNLATLYPAGRFADRRGRRPVIRLGLAVITVSLLLLSAADSRLSFLLAMAVLGPGSGMLAVAPAAVVGDVVTGRAGRAVAAYQMAGDLGSVVGPLVAGALAESVSYPSAFLVTAAVSALALVVQVGVPETRPRDGAAPVDPGPA
ncbi:MAG TPA: MFS transporter [Mycobacteriales bacterium]|nr:MFS transporter [Mycobacteriales bacterium]